MIVLDKYGYPLERVIGRPISNFIRMCIHGRAMIPDDLWNAICKNQSNKIKDMFVDQEPKNAAKK